MSEKEPGRLADELERDAAELERRSEELHGEVTDVRQDWQRKRADAGVPGAPPEEGDESEHERPEDSS
jgi:hypothetical protein